MFVKIHLKSLYRNSRRQEEGKCNVFLSTTIKFPCLKADPSMQESNVGHQTRFQASTHISLEKRQRKKRKSSAVQPRGTMSNRGLKVIDMDIVRHTEGCRWGSKLNREKCEQNIVFDGQKTKYVKNLKILPKIPNTGVYTNPSTAPPNYFLFWVFSDQHTCWSVSDKQK
jgi:hypothetical protein